MASRRATRPGLGGWIVDYGTAIAVCKTLAARMRLRAAVTPAGDQTNASIRPFVHEISSIS